MIRQFLKTVKIQEAMIAPVMTVKETDDFALVHEKFDLYGIRHLLVINEPGVLVGLISQHGLYKVHSPRKLEDGSWYYDPELLNGFILKNVMLADPITLKAEQTMFEAVETMVERKFGCIPIVDDYNMPVGILTRSDVLKFLLIK
jgi:CBS domain-containing protein